MDVKNLVFRGDLQPGGNWYGKVEKNEAGEKSLVLFQRQGERDTPQHLSDKINGVHKGEKLATEFINGKKLNLIGNIIKDKALLQNYLQSGHQTSETLTRAFHLVKNQIETPSGKIVIPAELSSSIGIANTQSIKIRWEP
jgi:hypothetical protein